LSIEDQMNRQVGSHGGVDRVDELAELDRPMASVSVAR
jgi:hypothetical protein